MSESLEDIKKLLEKKPEENELIDYSSIMSGRDNPESSSNKSNTISEDVFEESSETEFVINEEEKMTSDITGIIVEVKEDKPSKRGRKLKQQKEDDNLICDDDDVKDGGPKDIENIISNISFLIDGYYHQQLTLEVVKLYPDVILPAYKHFGDACMDLRANNIIWIKNEMGVKLKLPENFESITIYQGYMVKFGTGFKAKLPKGWSADVKIRSGISSEEGIILMNGEGKIDNPYTGEWCFCIGKINKCPLTINKNDRIVQFELRPQVKTEIIEVDSFEVDDNNERKDGGFGHSGLQ